VGLSQMASNICVVNAKGGCGKTTISTHLASALASSGLKTAIAEWDRHRGATHWLDLRPKEASKIVLADWRRNFGVVPKGVQRVVIDCPASLKSARVRKIAAEATILIVPILASVFDEYATRLFLKDLEQVKKIRKGRKKVIIVANRYKANSIASRRLEEFLEELGHPADHTISDRSAYPQLAAQGLSAFDLQTKPMVERQLEWLPLLQDIESTIQLPVSGDKNKRVSKSGKEKNTEKGSGKNKK